MDERYVFIVSAFWLRFLLHGLGCEDAWTA